MIAADQRTALLLELLGGLRSVPTPSTLSLEEWQAVLRGLDPRDARIVVLKVMHGLSDYAVAERLEISRTRAWGLWRRAIEKLRGKVDQLT